MKFIKIIFIGVLMSLSQQLFSQEKSQENKWKSNRPDGHAPIGVMGDHYHHKGEIMFSYRLMNMNMKQLLKGSDKISNDDAHSAGYMNTPLKMQMQMHMFGLMYAPSDKITLLTMINVVKNDMDLQMKMKGNTMKFSTGATGIGDLKLSMLYKFINKNSQSLHGQLGFSIPTGKIDAKDQTPMSKSKKIQLPYSMQLGSGTFDAILGLTYLGQTNLLSWGSQLKGTFRFGKNSDHYALGNRYNFNNWLAVKASNWVSFSARLQTLYVDKIKGSNPNLRPMMVSTADTKNYGGVFVNSGIGCNFYVPTGNLKNVRVGLEYTTPLYQKVKGIQLKQQESITVGLQYSM